MKVPFVKMQGAGNDFIMIDGRQRISFDPKEDSPVLCDRHFGVGADGLIVLEPSTKADFKMSYFNADGSRSICGNGMRCTARFIALLNALPEKHLRLETDAHIVGIDIIGKGDRIRVDMGAPIFEGRKIPTANEGEQVQVGLLVDGEQVSLTAVSMGNPHGVVFVPDLAQVQVRKLGPKLETHPFFPEKANIEFVEIIDRTKVKMRVWERGVGETLACGTGTCAVLAAGVKEGKLERQITLESPGGEFEVLWDDSTNHILLTGPAEEVFRGEADIEALRRSREHVQRHAHSTHYTL